MIDENYWEEEYYKFWDKFVKDWFDSGANPQDEISTVYSRILSAPKYGLKMNELPEPYQGDPKLGVDAVVLHLNPGAKQKGGYGEFRGKSLEATKCYSNIDDERNGWLIRKYRYEASYSYKKFINEIKFTYAQNGEQRSTRGLSCLNPDLRHSEPEVCGVDWWQGSDPNSVGGTMKWVRQIYDNDRLCPSRVFAPEICPFHSETFPTNGFRALIPFINEHVIVPTVTAVNENDLPFAVAIGASWEKVLTTLGARMVKKWDYKDKIENWPTTGFWKRTYKLYSVKIPNGLSAYVVMTKAVSYGLGLPAPEPAFKPIEKKIREAIWSDNL